MELILGRESSAARLHIIVNNQDRFYGNANSVPHSVSRQHCKITIDGQGGYTVTNLKPENVTYVNGIRIDSKQVTVNDRIELGNDRYHLNLKSILEGIMGPIPETYSIRPLEKIWKDYNETKLRVQIQERKSNAIRSVTGVLSMASIACGFIPGIPAPLRIVLYAVALILAIYFFVIAYRSSSTGPIFWNNLDKKFHEDYVCPNPKCRRFLGYQPYDDLKKTKKCFNCNAQYTEN